MPGVAGALWQGGLLHLELRLHLLRAAGPLHPGGGAEAPPRPVRDESLEKVRFSPGLWGSLSQGGGPLCAADLPQAPGQPGGRQLPQVFGQPAVLALCLPQGQKGRGGVPLSGPAGPKGHGGPSPGRKGGRRGGRLRRAHRQPAGRPVQGAGLRRNAGRGPGAIRLLFGPVGLPDRRRRRLGGGFAGGRL